MNRRSAALGGALALSLTLTGFSATSAAAATPAAQTADTARADTPTGDAAQALSQLRRDANGPVKVARDDDGAVTSLSSTDGRAMLDSFAATPARAVTETLADYGDALRIDGESSKVVVTKTLDSSTGGSVVRAQQEVDGVPVFGGQVVTTLDRQDDVVSVNAATTAATDVPATAISRARAKDTAVGLVARDQHVAKSRLQVVDQGEHLYDPALVHTVDPAGVRPVWQFEVSNGSDVRETVLVGAQRGEIALHFNNAPELNRKVCDNHDQRSVNYGSPVPVCSTAARAEGGAASAFSDVNKAYEDLGAVDTAYAELDGIDLTHLIGAVSGETSQPRLTATVRWCYLDLPCPFDNAFWDGTQMVFGDGYADADDVVGHELTHGYVERTSNLFYFHQSGSLNESLADTIGEIVDHRYNPTGPEDNSDWTLGEDLGDPVAERSLKDPTLHDQPDTMTSTLYANSPIDDDGDDSGNNDDGDVHLNDGVGNKTAYLISQGTAALPGGAFNGHTITGIDGNDAGLAKTGRLYLETIPALTSGSQYADLGTTLVSTCQRLAAAGTGGFSSADCTSVSEAVAATELATSPPGGAQQAAVTCVSNLSVNQLARDDDGVEQLGLTSSSGLWGRTDGGAHVPDYASSGKTSLYALDPDPSQGDPSFGDLVTKAFTLPLTTGGTFLNFHQAYVFDAGTLDGSYQYFDGGRVLVQRLVNGVWTTVTMSGSAWVNGPDKHVVGASSAGFTGFAGDSQGYSSSQLSLASLAGQTVRFVFRVEGDSNYFQSGWWVDDVRLYSCAQAAPSAPRNLGTRVSGSSVVVSWAAPASAADGVGSYRVTRSDGASRILPGSVRSVVLTGFRGTSAANITVSAGAPDRTYGPAAAKAVYATASSLGSSAAKVKKKKPFVLTARVVRRGSSSPVAGIGVVLQRKAGSSWTNVSSGTTGRSGTKAWTVRQSKSTYYRVVTRAGGVWFGSASSARLVKKK